jgi:hypothetical protein
MHYRIRCDVCKEEISTHTDLFQRHLHTGLAVPAPDDGLDLEAMRAKLAACQECIGIMRARYYGLGFLPWRSTAEASGPLA